MEKTGIPTVLIQHACNVEITTRLHPTSDVVLVWTKYDKESIKPKPGLRVFVVGNMNYEGLKNAEKNTDPTQVRAELQLPKSGDIVLFAGRYPIMDDIYRIALFEDVMKTMPEAVGIVKIHPAEAPGADAELKRMFPALKFIHKYDFKKLLVAASLVITNEHCTTCVDALILHKPVLTLRYDKGFYQPMTLDTVFPDPLPFMRIESDAEFKEEVIRMVLDTEAREALRQMSYNYEVNGNAVQNCHDILLHLMKGEEVPKCFT